MHACAAGKGDAREGEDAEDGEAGSQRRAREPKQGSTSPSSTLEPWEALNAKKLDVTFAVDPLFRRTSAQFDEGGARGAGHLLWLVHGRARTCLSRHCRCWITAPCRKMR